METSPRLKILYVTKWFMNRHDPQLGVFIRKHASASALFCDVSLLCVMGDVSQKSLLEFEEQETHGVNTLVVYFRKYRSAIPFIATLVNLARYLKASGAGLKHFEKKTGRHDVTHAYILLRPALIAWWLRLTKGIPFIVSEQWSGYATGAFAGKNFLTKFFYRFIFRKANAATVVSEFLKEKMEAAGFRNNISVTHNVVERLEKKSSPHPANGKTVILTVADLVDEIKNISAVIRAVAEISSAEKNFAYHIIGQGKDETRLKKMAADLGLLDSIIFFHGVKTNEEVFQYLHACDFLVMNSNFETFSLVCIEAMSCGKPVIATRCGGPQEFMNEKNGMLIGPGQDDQLKEAIMAMLVNHKSYDPKLLEAFAAQHFSPLNTGKKFEAVYRTALNS